MMRLKKDRISSQRKHEGKGPDFSFMPDLNFYSTTHFSAQNPVFECRDMGLKSDKVVSSYFLDHESDKIPEFLK